MSAFERKGMSIAEAVSQSWICLPDGRVTVGILGL